MASGAGKAAQPPGPGSAVNGTAAEFPNIEQELYDYQMHSKMCKKIAQLTKVIYSLNTKNEEQEAALQGLTYAHQEELHRIVMETCHEGEGSVLRTRLLELQESLDQQQRVGAQVQADFESFRAQAEERGRDAEVELRKGFEEKLQAAVSELQEARGQLSAAQGESLRLGRELESAGEQVRQMETRCEELQRASSTLPHASSGAAHAQPSPHYSTSSLPHKHTSLSLGQSASPSLPRSVRSRASCTPPTPAPTGPLPVCPPPPTGIRYVLPSSQEPRLHPQAQSIRGLYVEQRGFGPGTGGLQQEWLTKYFSF